MSTKTKNRIAKGQNGTPEAPAPDRPAYDVLQTKLLEVTTRADGELARRVKEREALAPLVYGIIRTLSGLASSGEIEQVKLRHFEPGEYGETGDMHCYPERIQFSWSVVGYDHRYTGESDFSITLMSGEL